MTSTFDDLIFLISTDCFTAELFSEFPPRDVEKVKHAARRAVPIIVDGGDNYFMCADLSPARIEKTQRDFFIELEEQRVGFAIQQKIRLFHEILLGITEHLRAASYTIRSVAARLYWLDTDKFHAQITDELLALIALVEPLGLDRESHGYGWADIWLNSPSKWDKYVMSLMDGIDEVPYLTFRDITKFSSQFDFLSVWKGHLGEARFSVIKDYIVTEAHAELDLTDPNAAEEVDRIMSAV